MNFDPNTEIKSISISTLRLSQFDVSIQKPSQFRPPPQNPVNSDPYTVIESLSILHTKVKSISTTPPKNKSISRPTIKSSQFGPRAQNEVNFEADTKTKSVSARTQSQSKFRPPRQRPSEPRYMFKDSVLTRNRYTSLLLCDC